MPAPLFVLKFLDELDIGRTLSFSIPKDPPDDPIMESLWSYL